MPRLPASLLLTCAAAIAVCSAGSRPVVAGPAAAYTPPSVQSPLAESALDRWIAEPEAAEESSAASILLTSLRAAAPEIDPGVLALALEARACALNSGAAGGTRLAVIDYSLPSTRKRMWVFDLQQPGLLYAEHVAHGQGSGENLSNRFSNVDGSHQTSLGLFRTAETYVGGNGYSLRMDGLEPGVNDNARDRLIVIHGAPYVNPDQAQRQGRLGRSYGCPALRPQVAREIIDTIKNEQLVFAYYPDDPWLTGSRFFGCGGRTAGQILADARGQAATGDALASADRPARESGATL
ncbi:murein L,D-transpeptidase catalytic domain family protein [Lysobacter ciconiae]|uniref:Murein L,D-transpeptidase catalytic domain family protein n=1 Tax=Novilysobacter ciconiae TaxID=2781022 RepID=A0A7S6UFZ7_9GAMM|nr:murein L,D-transpeptidase catalytic domain family protein [Lysobacter ciconiae]QOW19582.1 murein L,D-transpeptidase catalytic domain family protein [Lysobacter ciconiae]